MTFITNDILVFNPERTVGGVIVNVVECGRWWTQAPVGSNQILLKNIGIG